MLPSFSLCYVVVLRCDSRSASAPASHVLLLCLYTYTIPYLCVGVHPDRVDIDRLMLEVEEELSPSLVNTFLTYLLRMLPSL